MIGCSFVVDREYFGDIGLLDPGMEVYGGENIELGMRVSGRSGDWVGRAGLGLQLLALLSGPRTGRQCEKPRWRRDQEALDVDVQTGLSPGYFSSQASRCCWLALERARGVAADLGGLSLRLRSLGARRGCRGTCPHAVYVFALAGCGRWGCGWGVGVGGKSR